MDPSWNRVEKTSFRHSAELKAVQRSIEGSLKSDPTPSSRKSRRFGVARGHADGGPRSWGRTNGVDGGNIIIEKRRFLLLVFRVGCSSFLPFHSVSQVSRGSVMVIDSRLAFGLCCCVVNQ